jgi:hypothetical protein
MLHDFLREHRQDLINRAAAKVRARPAPKGGTRAEASGVPVFLTQLGEVLKAEATSATPMPFGSAIGKSATQRGGELLRMGFTVGQVVHGYGDVCQAITELAQVVKFTITTHEFQSLNRALDDAIAEAVTEYGRQRELSLTAAETERAGTQGDEQRDPLCSAILAWQMLLKGTVGVGGSTGAVLTQSLEALRTLHNRAHPARPIPDPNSMVT